MIPKIAWRNIWRSRTRSMVVILSIIIGIWALVFLLAFLRGQVNNYISNIIENETSHIQIHDNKFKDDFEVKLFVPNARDVRNTLMADENIKAVSSRVILNGMLASSARGLWRRALI